MPLKIVHGDITKMSVDAVVNAANTKLKMGGGVCGAIFSAAGAVKLQAECDSIGVCKVGEAVITSAYDLPAKYIIHTVGPIWRGGDHNEAKLLRSCYLNSYPWLKSMTANLLLFLISSGIYGYPKDEAMEIAISAIEEFLRHHELEVYLVLYKG